MKNLVWQKFILGTGNLEVPLRKGLGGVIFFTKDIEKEEQFRELVAEIKAKAIIPPFLSIDQEGGRVERTENIRPKRLSARFAYDFGKDFLQAQSEEISKELKDLGINLNFAPCVDVNTNPLNPIIGERAFSDKPDEVILGAEIFINASRKYGIIPCIKHFPGHGDADRDSHLTLPRIDLSLKEMEDIHIKPFEYFSRKKIEMIMVAHLHCTCFDKTILPTSLSKNAIDYLRKKIGFKGVIISDDMVMQGVQDYGSLEAVIMAIEAGVDMFIFRESNEQTIKMIDMLSEIVEKDKDLHARIKESNDRILRLKELL